MPKIKPLGVADGQDGSGSDSRKMGIKLEKAVASKEFGRNYAPALADVQEKDFKHGVVESDFRDAQNYTEDEISERNLKNAWRVSKMDENENPNYDTLVDYGDYMCLGGVVSNTRYKSAGSLRWARIGDYANRDGTCAKYKRAERFHNKDKIGEVKNDFRI